MNETNVALKPKKRSYSLGEQIILGLQLAIHIVTLPLAFWLPLIGFLIMGVSGTGGVGIAFFFIITFPLAYGVSVFKSVKIRQSWEKNASTKLFLWGVLLPLGWLLMGCGFIFLLSIS